MKIAVASDDYKTVSGHVGRCRGFIIYEIENGKIVESERRKNSFTHHSRGRQQEEHRYRNSGRGAGEGRGRGSGQGAGNRQGHQRLAEGLSDCKYLISLGMGWRLVDDLKSEGITPIVTGITNIEEAALKAAGGKLKNVDDGICR